MKPLHFICLFLAINLPCVAQPGMEAAIPKEAFVKSRFYDIYDTKVRCMDGTKLTGQLIFLDRNKIVIRNRRNGRQTTLAGQNIEAIYIREKGSTGLGVLAGLATGAALGYVAGSTASDGGSPNGYFGSLSSKSGIGAATLGAVTGAVIGGLLTGRRTRYEINGQPGNLSDLSLRLNLQRK